MEQAERTDFSKGKIPLRAVIRDVDQWACRYIGQTNSWLRHGGISGGVRVRRSDSNPAPGPSRPPDARKSQHTMPTRFPAHATLATPSALATYYYYFFSAPATIIFSGTDYDFFSALATPGADYFLLRSQLSRAFLQ